MNFDFIKKFSEFNKLYNYCFNSEKFISSDYNISVGQARCASEYIVKFIFNSKCGSSEGKTAFEMITSTAFINYINDSVYINCLHYIRKMGNIAIHEGNISKDRAIAVLKELHYIVCEFFIMLGLINDYSDFVVPESNLNEEKTNADSFNSINEVVVENEVLAIYGEKMKYTKFSTKYKRDEKENKKLFLSACLTDSGWPIVNKRNTPMPCSVGVNMIIDTQDTCDFILYGKDNKPLAIIEFTVTCENLLEGRKKACEKAEKLAKKYGYKPVVYYTNGYFIYCIDQLGYAPRRVFNFHTRDELEWILFQRTSRKDITKPVINPEITDRPYQKDAITAICNAYSSFRRKSLLVLATGTGKTRVSISTVDILMKAGWIKNVLFLADRTSLVKQAHKNFNKLLPNVTTSIYTGDSFDRDENAKIIFSTYQTMINLINEDTKDFSIGRFDLIIIDEAHRSIFKKYSAIFDYFDSLMLGLTATPRNEENKSTYDVFDLPDGEPDYAYELVEAIKDNYLVGFAVIDKTTEDLRRGIKYSDLSEEDKRKLEDAFDNDSFDDDNYIRLSGKVINIGTIDVMLNELMTNGLKIDGGDILGKTIIFAKSHAEAEVIVNRFNKIYGNNFHSDFCKLIDSHIENSQNLIERFEVRGGYPNIAVSVDMLDTGIDVPDILNLVFFKQIRSKIKFLQMIGRGTRLSSDIFGRSLDKKGFIVFDYFDNFNYFSERDTWSTTHDKSGSSTNISSLTHNINYKKLNILQGLEYDRVLTAFETKYVEELKNHFIHSVQSLVNDNIAVQMNMAYVNKYRTPEIWEKITDKQFNEICEKIIPLFPASLENPKIKTFDGLMLFIEQTFKEKRRNGLEDDIIAESLISTVNSINRRINELLSLKSIPEIVNKSKVLEELYNCNSIFEDFSLEKTEFIRKEVRGLMIYLIDNVGSYAVIDHKDYELIEPTYGTSPKEKTYKEKVKDYLSDSKNLILAKIMNLDELTKEEQKQLEDQFTNLMGSQSDFKNISNGLKLLPYIRSQIGFTDDAINKKFGSFLNNKVLSSQQLLFCNQIIDYTRVNGDFTAIVLQNVSPFCDIDVVGLFGTNFIYVKQLITGLHKPVEWKN